MKRTATSIEILRLLNSGLAGSKKNLRARLRKEQGYGIVKRNNSIAESVLAADKAAREKRRQRARSVSKENSTDTSSETERSDG